MHVKVTVASLALFSVVVVAAPVDGPSAEATVKDCPGCLADGMCYTDVDTAHQALEDAQPGQRKIQLQQCFNDGTFDSSRGSNIQEDVNDTKQGGSTQRIAQNSTDDVDDDTSQDPNAGAHVNKFGQEKTIPLSQTTQSRPDTTRPDTTFDSSSQQEGGEGFKTSSTDPIDLQLLDGENTPEIAKIHVLHIMGEASNLDTDLISDGVVNNPKDTKLRTKGAVAGSDIDESTDDDPGSGSVSNALLKSIRLGLVGGNAKDLD
ncbi:hypothetical protein DL96DRAFT_1560864 [Flagelloscypha sp. PMI_526]|nr:hypothetical protein DL96DRAFT_1560864 [Flagelloscypha sp. PMI_526]